MSEIQLEEPLTLFLDLPFVETFRAAEKGREVTLVRATGETTVADALREDLRRIEARRPEGNELALLEVREPHPGLVYGLFEALPGVPLLDVAARAERLDVRAPEQVAAAIVLELLKTESAEGRNTVSWLGTLERWFLPRLESVETVSGQPVDRIDLVGRLLEGLLDAARASRAMKIITRRCLDPDVPGAYVDPKLLAAALDPHAVIPAIAPFVLSLWERPTESAPVEETLQLFYSEEDQRPMVAVQEGFFFFGENPERRRTPGFLIDRNLVSNGAFNRYLVANGRPPRESPEDPQWHDRPAVNVSFEEAAGFAAWANKRLPSDEEWEKAARGQDRRRYPWGDDLGPEGCSSAWVEREPPWNVPLPAVESTPHTSPWGAADLLTVWEWTSTQTLPAGFVVRGGPWRDERRAPTLLNRSFENRPGPDVGFRCVRDL